MEKDYNSFTENEKRFYQRNLTKKGNYSLNQTTKNADVKNNVQGEKKAKETHYKVGKK